MSVYCDACETELGDEVSDCCKADVWGVFRALTGSTYICQECGKECNLIKPPKRRSKLLEDMKVDHEKLWREDRAIVVYVEKEPVKKRIYLMWHCANCGRRVYFDERKGEMLCEDCLDLLEDDVD